MTGRMVRVTDADVRIRTIALFTRQLECDHARDIRLKGQNLQVEHELRMVGERRWNTHGPVEIGCLVLVHSLLGTLNREFQPRQAELQALQTKINTLTKEIDDTQTVADPNAIRQKREQLAQLNTDFKRKAEDAEAAYAKRRQDIFLPLQQDIGKALEVFAKARGITVIVDGSQVPVVYAADSIDSTRVFINDFNSKNPATAAVTQP